MQAGVRWASRDGSLVHQLRTQGRLETSCRTTLTDAPVLPLEMIDLHCHLLPGIDDGSPNLDTTLEMARIAVDDGISTIFCTPHIYPGLYDNRGPDIKRRVDALRLVLGDQSIKLSLNFGADVHLVPEVLEGLSTGRIPTLGGSRYLLLEPAHTVRPPRFLESVFAPQARGFVPVITHPERLTWADEHYTDFLQLARSGCWLQITAGALLGTFGKRAQMLAERLTGDGWTAVIASDAHTTQRRAPRLSQAHLRAAQLVGSDEAKRCVYDRPLAIVNNSPAGTVHPPPAMSDAGRGISPVGTLKGKLLRWIGK